MNRLSALSSFTIILLFMPSLSHPATLGDAAVVDARGLIRKNDHTEQLVEWDLGVSAADLPAKVRFKIATSSAKEPWVVQMSTTAESMLIRSTDRSVREGVDNALELLVVDTQPLKVRLSKTAPDLIYIAMVRETASQTPQFIISKVPNPRYFDVDFSSDQFHRQLARAVVRLDFDIVQEGYTGETYCTGFQIAPGTILTNLHCIDSPFRPADKRRFTVIRYGVDDQHPDGQAFVIGEVTAKGRFPTGQVQGGLDYAVLKAPAAPRGFEDALVDLTSGQDPVGTGQPLEMYQMWAGVGAFGNGKALVANDECVTGSLPDTSGVRHLTDTACPAPDFVHGCDAQGGSSGSPIFIRGTNKLVGIHYGEIQNTVGNCALSVTALQAQLPH